MLLLYPPQSKPSEPPASLAYLQSALKQQGISCKVCDMNIEALHFIIEQNQTRQDTWTRRATKNRNRNLQLLQNKEGYSNRDRYSRAVYDINRLVENYGKQFGLHLCLSNYQDPELSPLKSQDLRESSASYTNNVYTPYFARRLEELLSDTEDNAAVGISLCYLSQALCTFAIIGYLRDHHPQRKIVVGGGLVTTWMSSPVWKNPFGDLVDLFIGGPGETPLLQYLSAENNENLQYGPDYTNLHSNSYLAPGFILPYTSSRGCYWKKCRFCPETSEDNPYSHNSPLNTIQELADLSRRYRPTLIHFLDNAISPATLQAIAIKGLSSPWYGFVRFENLLEDLSFCKALKHSGCIMLKLGLESGDQAVLNDMHKGTELPRVSRILGNLHKAEIATYIYLLFGTPSENYQSAQQTQQFVQEHHEQINFINLAIFNLPLHSTQVEQLSVQNFYEGDLTIYRDFKHPKGWHRGLVRRYLDLEFKKVRLIAPVLKNDPPYFTSNHAPFRI